MFTPLRFDEKLKAQPGLAHLFHTKSAEGHVRTHVTEKVNTETVQTAGTGVEETRTRTKEEVTVHEGKGGAPAHAHIKAEVDVTQTQTQTTAEGTTETLSHVHETIEGVAGVELSPPHPPREETPEYVKTHHHLAIELDSPCAICGVRNTTLKDPKHNLFGSKAIETHHYPVERSLLDACDPAKIGVVFPQVKDHKSLEAFVDSEANMMIVCDIHHRHPLYGIHHLVSQDFFVQPFLYGGYEVAADSKDAAVAMAADEKIVRAHLTAEEIARG